LLSKSYPTIRSRPAPKLAFTNMLRPSITAAGLDPDALPQRGAIDIGKDIDIGARESRRGAGAISGAPDTRHQV
jgi:hypothetical protein